MTAVVTALALLCCALYSAAAHGMRARGDAWPWRREAVCWLGGAVLTGSVPLSSAGHSASFTTHMGGHLGTAMVAPLLFALARPVTLALRTLPVPARRRFLSWVRSRPAGLLVWPPVAAALDVGGLWLLYRTPLLAATHRHAWLNTLVHVHLFAAGVLFTFGVLALDPVRHRAGHGLRAGTLLAAAAAHAVLAKSLYAAGPPGLAFTPSDLHAGAQLMYYGGDVVEVALAVVLGLRWYRERGRARAASRVPAVARARARPGLRGGPRATRSNA